VRVAALVVIAGCGRVGFEPNERCATAVFTNPAASSIVDDFSAGALGSAWMRNDTCITETGGELVATPPASGNYCFAYTAQTYHLSCDSVTVEVPEVVAAELGAQTLIYVTGGGMELNLLLEGAGFQLGGPDDLLAGARPYDPVADKWWRLAESDGTLSFSTSPDGTTWTTLGSGADPFSLDEVGISIGAGTYEQVANPGEARFHCYNKPPPCS